MARRDPTWDTTFIEILQRLQVLDNIDQETFIFWMARDQCDFEQNQHKSYIDVMSLRRTAMPNLFALPSMDPLINSSLE
jgi:hypothetical protein